jgi:hypothetical protein
MENETKETVTHYSMSFKGVFGRNRTEKLDCATPRSFAHGTRLADEDLARMAAEYCRNIGAKAGRVVVRLYADVEETSYESVFGGRVKTTCVKPFEAIVAYTSPVVDRKLVTRFDVNQSA